MGNHVLDAGGKEGLLFATDQCPNGSRGGRSGMSLRDEPQAPRLRAPSGSACEDTWHQRTPDQHTDHQAVFAFAILLGHAGVLREQGVRSAARPRRAGLWRWRPADYLVRALGILEKFSEPANRTVEVMDGPAQDFGLAGPGGLDATWEVGLPGGKRQKVAFDDDESDPGSVVWGDAPHIHVGGQLGPLERHAPWEPAPLDHGGSQESAPLTSTHVGAPPTCQGPRHCQ